MYLAAVSMLCLLSSHQGCRGSQPAASSVMCGFPVRLPKQLNTLAPAQDMSHCQPLLVTYILHTHSTHNQHIYHTPCAESTHLISALTPHTHLPHAACTCPHTTHLPTQLAHGTHAKNTCHVSLTCVYHVSLTYTHPIHARCQSHLTQKSQCSI